MNKQECPECGQTVKPMMTNGVPTCPKCGADMEADDAGKSAAAKVGARNSQADLGRIQAMHDHAVALGANCTADDPALPGKSAGRKPAGATNWSPASFAYIKSLHLPFDEQYVKDVVAAKFIGHDEILHYTNLWGDPGLVDVEQEFFTKGTDFWDKSLGMPRPLTYDHGQDPATQEKTVIGKTVEYGDDRVGRWAVSQLDRNHEYRAAIDDLIGKRALGTSSDSAPQYVIRQKAVGTDVWTKTGLGLWTCGERAMKAAPAGGAVWLKQWPLFASALTPTPAEHRMFDTVRFKSLGIEVPANAEASLAETRGGAELESLKRRERELTLFI